MTRLSNPLAAMLVVIGGHVCLLLGVLHLADSGQGQRHPLQALPQTVPIRLLLQGAEPAKTKMLPVAVPVEVAQSVYGVHPRPQNVVPNVGELNPTVSALIDSDVQAPDAYTAEPRPQQDDAQQPQTRAGQPDYAHNPLPAYPALLREQGIGGVVWLRVWVDGEGRAGEVKLAKGSGFRLLDEAALQAVRQWRFIPAQMGDQKLASWVEFPIRFALTG